MELTELIKWKDAKQVEVSGVVYGFQFMDKTESPDLKYTFVSRTIGLKTYQLRLMNLDKRIKSFIILGGTINSGKGVVTDLLKEKGFYAASTHDIVAGACDALRLAHNRSNMQLAGFLCNINNPDQVQNALASQFNAAAEKGCTKVVFDGLRFDYEINANELAAPSDCKVLALFVDAPYEVRLARAIKADEKSTRPVTSDEFCKQDKVEQELFGTKWILENERVICLNNDCDRDYIKHALEDVLKQRDIISV